MIREIGAHGSDGRPRLQVETAEEWRGWLERNHDGAGGVWLVSWKRATGKPFVDYGDAVDEALCFGWIDSRVNTLDDERAMRLFTPRNPKSPWSRINKDKVARLMREGRLAEAGARTVATAQSNGSWTLYDEIEDLVIPPDLASALADDETAGARFCPLSGVVQEEHPVVDKVGAETGDQGGANREDGGTGGGEPDGEPPGGAGWGAGGLVGVAAACLRMWATVEGTPVLILETSFAGT